MDPMQPAGQPQAPMPDDQGAPEGGGYCIEIKVKADGSFSVSKEDMPAEAAEPGEAQEPEQSIGTLGEALKAVMDIVKANPPGGGAEDQFAAGFNGGPAESRPLRGAM